MIGPCSGPGEGPTEGLLLGYVCVQGSRSQGFASALDSLIRSSLAVATGFGEEVTAMLTEQGMLPSVSTEDTPSPWVEMRKRLRDSHKRGPALGALSQDMACSENWGGSERV